MNRDDLIAELVLKWEEASDHGRDIPVDDLCAGHPGVAGDVARRVAALKAMAWVKDAGPGDGGATDERPIPTVLGGRYRIEGLIAEGGMGVVYRAHDPELDRRVAVKVPRLAGAADGMVAEARRAAGLRHPGIVSVHDVGREGDVCYVVSDLIDGTDLAGRIAREPLPWREAVRLVAEVADALGFAHDHGFVHRDIKPANVLLDPAGRPLLTDFGIAATFDEARRDGGPGSGTLPYMAPEQVAGEVQLIDARTDLYSLGVVLYEALTGGPPYQARTPTAVREQILFRPPVPVRTVAPGVPEGVEAVVARCLAKHPADRHGSAAELATALRNTLAPPAPRPARWGRPLGWVAVVVAAGLIPTVVSLWPRSASPPADAPPAEPIPFVTDGAMFFDGQTRIVTPLERFSPATLEAWVWPERYEYRCHFVVGSDVPKRYGIGLGVCGVLLSAEYAEGVIKSDATVPLRKWSHLAAVFGGEETRLYLNGRAVATGPATKAVDGARFVVGNVGPDNPIDYFLGRVRAARISRGERYTGDFEPPEAFAPDAPDSPTRAVLTYDGAAMAGDTVTDLSGAGNHGRVERLPGP